MNFRNSRWTGNWRRFELRAIRRTKMPSGLNVGLTWCSSYKRLGLCRIATRKKPRSTLTATRQVRENGLLCLIPWSQSVDQPVLNSAHSGCRLYNDTHQAVESIVWKTPPNGRGAMVYTPRRIVDYLRRPNKQITNQSRWQRPCSDTFPYYTVVPPSSNEASHSSNAPRQWHRAV